MTGSYILIKNNREEQAFNMHKNLIYIYNVDLVCTNGSLTK